MGGTFLYLMTRYYGDKNSTNTSQRIRPRVFHSSLRSVVLPGNNLWWWISSSWSFSYIVVLEYPLLGRNATSDAIYDPLYLVDSLLVVTSEQQSPCHTLQSPPVQPEVVSLLYRTRIAGGAILPLNTQWVIHCKLHSVMAGSPFKTVCFQKVCLITMTALLKWEGCLPNHPLRSFISSGVHLEKHLVQ